MTRLSNAPAAFADEALEDFVAAHRRWVRPVSGGVVRDAPTAPGQVAVVTDDISSADAADPEKRRGIAGDLPVFKAAAAAAEHITTVCAALAHWLDARPQYVTSRVIYGGSAGPGLLGTLGDGADGLFLGRFAHDPEAVELILDEMSGRAAGKASV